MPEISLLHRLAPVRRDELAPVGAALGFVFCVFTAYMMMRPVRETMGITAGIANLPALFWSIFAGMLLIQPLLGFLSARLRRTVLVPVLYGVLALSIACFYVWYRAGADEQWIARTFYVWMSVTNLTAVSVFWSLMADVFRPEQARRLFGLLSAGASAGGIVGPLLTSELALRVGTLQLLPVAMTFLLVAPVFALYLTRWHARQQTPGAPRDVNRAIGGSALAGFRLVFEQPRVLGIAVFAALLSWLGTYLYLQQAQFIGAAFASIDERTRVFARIDLTVQVLSLATQLLIFNLLVRWLGVSMVLALVPFILAFGCVAMAFTPIMPLLIGLMIVRRVGEYAITKPAREVLFTGFDRETKYKAKNLIDTAVTRAPEGPAGSTYLPLVAATSAAAVSWVNAVLALAAAGLGYALGRASDVSRAPAAAVNAERT